MLSRSLFVILTAAFVFPVALTYGEPVQITDSPAAAPEIHSLRTSDGVDFKILGAPPKSPAPTLFVLALDAERTLADPLYRRCGNQLANQSFLCVSVDLPCHGQERRPDEPEGLAGWRKRVDDAENPMTELTSRLSKVLSFLIEQKMSDPERIATCGTSRGGFAALHFAAADERVKAVAAYSPVTELVALREFQDLAKNTAIEELNLQHHSKRLAKCPIWIMIGDRDQRVGTDQAIQFARALSISAAAQNLPSAAELHVCPSNGHHTPAGAEEQSAAWILRQFNLSRPE